MERYRADSRHEKARIYRAFSSFVTQRISLAHSEVLDFQSSALPTELPAHRLRPLRLMGRMKRLASQCDPGFVLKAAGRVKSASGLLPTLLNFLLGKCNDLGFQAHIVEHVDFLHPGRTGHVDLGQILANDVEADKV